MTYVPAVSVATFWTYENSWCWCCLSVAYRYTCLPQDLFATLVPLLLAAMVELRCLLRFSSCFCFNTADQLLPSCAPCVRHARVHVYRHSISTTCKSMETFLWLLRPQ